MVAEQGIMQRRTPDAVRSRVLAAFDAVLSLGLAFAYILAGPVLAAIGPQTVYLLGGFAAVIATGVLFPLRHLSQAASASTRAVPDDSGLEVERAVVPPTA
jgi:MFS family permease